MCLSSIYRGDGEVEYPPLLQGLTAAQYREHFERTYCCGPVDTFDGIAVRFRRRDFNHAFFESSSPKHKDDLFSIQRAEHIDWIKATLQDPDADLYVGYDNKKKRTVHNRRVAIVKGCYVVIIALTGSHSAVFITAFISHGPAPGRLLSTVDLIRREPKWA